jgi:hypothetical protein
MQFVIVGKKKNFTILGLWEPAAHVVEAYYALTAR